MTVSKSLTGSAAPSSDIAETCSAGGTEFSFSGQNFEPLKKEAFVVGNVVLKVTAPTLGTQIKATNQPSDSFLTNGVFNDTIINGQVIAQVVPEPGTALLMALGLAGLGSVGRSKGQES